MNQIIYSGHSDNSSLSDKNVNNSYFYRKYLIRILFFLLVIFCLIAIVYYICFRYDLYLSERVSKSILDNFGLTKIYQNSSDYDAELLDRKVVFYENSSFSVIGTINIEKLGISYPILSDVSKDSLKIAPCRFYGPLPNEIR